MSTFHISFMIDDVPYYFTPNRDVLTVQADNKLEALQKATVDYGEPFYKADNVCITEEKAKQLIPEGTFVLSQGATVLRGIVIQPVRDSLHDGEVMVAWQDGQQCVEQVTDLTDHHTGQVFTAKGKLGAHITNVTWEHADHRDGSTISVRGEAGHHKFCQKGTNVMMPCVCHEYRHAHEGQNPNG